MEDGRGLPSNGMAQERDIEGASTGNVATGILKYLIVSQIAESSLDQAIHTLKLEAFANLHQSLNGESLHRHDVRHDCVLLDKKTATSTAVHLCIDIEPRCHKHV